MLFVDGDFDIVVLFVECWVCMLVYMVLVGIEVCKGLLLCNLNGKID